MARAPRGTRKQFTRDSFQNFVSDVGLGTNNQSSGATYGFNPITRNHVLLEWAYRGSWIVRKTVDCPAEDLTRQGVSIHDDDVDADVVDAIQDHWKRLQIWGRLASTIKWARLYGGCVAVIMIEGHKLHEPLRIDTVGRGQFRGLVVMDRWMVQPDFTNLVTDPGADYGHPVFYDVVADARTLPTARIHHSRTIRFDGIELPYWQQLAENGWGLSVVEPLWDRLVAYDSTTQGAAQLVYRAHLRTLKLSKLREAIAAGGRAYQAVLKQVNVIRQMQSNEGLTLLDAEDVMETSDYSFAGLSDMMAQFGQQLSGSADVPLTRMFGQSPSGLNSTGDSDLRNYYDGLRSQQENKLTVPVHTLFELSHRSLYGRPLPDGFSWAFNPLWQLSDPEKESITAQRVSSVVQAVEAQIVTPLIAARELRALGRLTGAFTSITTEALHDLAENPPAPAGPEGDPGSDQPPAPSSQGGATPEGGEDETDDAAPSEVISEHLDRYPPHRRIARHLGREDAAADLALALEHRRSPAGRVEAFAQLGTATRDQYPVREYHGHQLVIETPRGHRRVGYGWSVEMPCDYGYVSGTNSAEGPTEQLDCYVGDDLTAPRVWVIDQLDPLTKQFDEHKVMIGFPSRAVALDHYRRSFSDDLRRLGAVRELTPEKFTQFVNERRYGQRPPTQEG